MTECASLATLLNGLLSGKVVEILPEPIGTLPSVCAKVLVSQVLGYAIVTGSALVKLPQFIKIARAQSAEGLSLSSMIMEMCASISLFCYYIALGYPFSTWGENFFLFFQNIALTLLVLHYSVGLASGKSVVTILFCGMLGAVLYRRSIPDVTLPSWLCSTLNLPRCSVTCEDMAGGLPSVLLLLGRIPQIVQNVKQGHAGQLALITYLMNTLGCIARIFTTLQQLNDPITLFTVTTAAVQNAVLLAQIILLGSAPPAAAGKKRE
ncbi:hypothetical protein AB1Y20_010158 [Prymnesium parvum]|uniref:Mannose-P-dolichol utilization defect 1 protein homolog n=1 Tax=Prymnesium parvum TaxID=97485 RepID=A0AB34K837_PRYPA|mmetsp:Transcript_8631/g.21313  ORF Transcript_8631/g.21313 Transcript_8631/m.21313 type:complete len:265 (-) Transcript_8631:383-1177(-)